ncbi:thrombopoietin receptor isoform X2 [Protopterus annectens]|uniref:thrombopoietin receptor isoform X2 n=1 Tax=Protopterus annectens TaxID=7888 RepID=UPI001CFB5150|nr:thrombopoietin receptor isoform X2 [Protopterus annectens]
MYTMDSISTAFCCHSPRDQCYGRNGYDIKECPLVSHTIKNNTSRHICNFPEYDILLFTLLVIAVKAHNGEEIKYNRTLFVDQKGIFPQPTDVKVSLNGNLGQLHVSWTPYLSIWGLQQIYQLQYSVVEPEYSGPTQVLQIEYIYSNSYLLQGLLPGITYEVKVRSRPNNNEEIDGFWNSWSQSAYARTPFSADDVNLHCFTADLKYVICTWNSSKEMEPYNFYSLYYQTSDNTWSQCQQQNYTMEGDTISHCCLFYVQNQGKNTVTVKLTAPLFEKTFYKEPFQMENIVRPYTPEILYSNHTHGKLTLQWKAPIKELEDHLHYQIRYSMDNSSEWQLLQIQQSVTQKTLDMVPSKTYVIQVRAKPNGNKYNGFWSSWSDSISLTDMSISDGISGLSVVMIVVAGSLILVLTALSRCYFPFLFRKIKEKIWPPVPDLDKVLEGILLEISKKQFQSLPPFCEKVYEEDALPSLVEILSEIKAGQDKDQAGNSRTNCTRYEGTTRTDSNHQDYVTLDPKSSFVQHFGNEYIDEQMIINLSPQGRLFRSRSASDIDSPTRLENTPTEALLGYMGQSCDLPRIGQTYSECLNTVHNQIDLLQYPPISEYQTMVLTDISNRIYIMMSHSEPDIL